MKSTRKCPKCRSERVGYLANVLGDGDPHGGASRSQSYGRRKVGVAQTRSNALPGHPVIEGYGDFEAFICTECGYFEEYAKEPTAIAWEKIEGFRWCKPSGTN